MVYPNLAVRYTTNRHLKVNAENSLVTETDNRAQHKNATGLEPVALGINYLLRGETKTGPAICHFF